MSADSEESSRYEELLLGRFVCGWRRCGALNGTSYLVETNLRRNRVAIYVRWIDSSVYSAQARNILLDLQLPNTPKSAVRRPHKLVSRKSTPQAFHWLAFDTIRANSFSQVQCKPMAEGVLRGPSNSVQGGCTCTEVTVDTRNEFWLFQWSSKGLETLYEANRKQRLQEKSWFTGDLY